MHRLPDSIWRLEGLLELHVCLTVLEVLPDEIENLKKLKVLDLSHTGVRKLPASIGKLKKLEKLHASHAMLEGEVPSDIGELSFMKFWNYLMQKSVDCQHLLDSSVNLSRLS
ncbi:hypothetical protein MLD38_029406 [Melastoma candidum]|uniref:Uncharacterized protein n=1 Tax=Melastoma candidum TaxID=119954 RepID=A0ACB9N5H8_9MYRT|nr:hypothetical protein MLD38_029406 [Melastoma candidum]